jgi:hypothetical protein
VDEKRTGPIDDRQWPETFQAHVVDTGGDHAGEPRLFGYAVEGDLAANYGFSDLVLLAATGELPDPRAARALEVALTYLAATSVAEAPVHAACLARLSGAEPTGLVGVAAIALAEQARFVLAEQAHACHQAANDAERESVERLRQILGEIPFPVPALEADLGRTAALMSVLFAVGLRSSEQVALAFIMARLPVAVAEARHVQPGGLRDYPMNTPAFEYAPGQVPE